MLDSSQYQLYIADTEKVYAKQKHLGCKKSNYAILMEHNLFVIYKLKFSVANIKLMIEIYVMIRLITRSMILGM